MNRNEQQDAKLINVLASDIIGLLKIKEDRKNFAMEMSKNITILKINKDWLFPAEKGLTTTFLLKVMAGENKVIQIFNNFL